MKKSLFLLALAAGISLQNFAQGWPSAYEGVMLQGFYWDSFNDSRWTKLEAQSNEIAPYFNLIWIPQSGNCNTGNNVMGQMHKAAWPQAEGTPTSGSLLCPEDWGWSTGLPSHGFAKAATDTWKRVGRHQHP